MLLFVVAVKDRAADAFGRPMFVPSTGVAIRSFSDEVNRDAEDNQLNRHPDDFDLFDFGIFDDVSGTFDLHPSPMLLALGKQVKVL